MKSCPTCKRTYADDTLIFCLDDGTRLSAAYDPNSEKTEILPGGIPPAPQAVPPPSPRTTIPAPPPQYTYGSPRTADKGSSKPWIAVIAILAVSAIALIVAAVLLVWKANRQTDSQPLAVSSPTPTPAPTQAPSPVKKNVRTNPSPETSPTATPDLEWLEGVWQGEGFQTDTKTTWTARLTVRGEKYLIDYPDIPCSGTWKPLDKNSRAASFTEVITQGTDRCVTDSHVTVEKTSASEISARYTHLRSRDVYATVTMSKK